MFSSERTGGKADANGHTAKITIQLPTPTLLELPLTLNDCLVNVKLSLRITDGLFNSGFLPH